MDKTPQKEWIFLRFLNHTSYTGYTFARIFLTRIFLTLA